MKEIIANPKRLPYIDVAKGLLILCLFYGHTIVYGRILGINDAASHLIGKTGGIYNSYFMQTFFIITGFCSNFSSPFLSFLKKNIKTILLPGIILYSLGNFLYEITLGQLNLYSELTNLINWFIAGGEWFIISLFLSKLIMWKLLRLPKTLQISILVTLYLSGLLLNEINIIPNIWWHKHVMFLLPFLYLGNLSKDKIHIIEKYIKLIGTIGIISIIIQTILSTKGLYDRPFQDHSIHVNFYNFPIHYINVITGTSFIIYISKKLESIHILQEIGYGSLFMFLWNGVFIRIYIKALISIDIISTDNQYSGFIFYMVVMFLSLLTNYLVMKIIYSNKYLCWIVGKW